MKLSAVFLLAFAAAQLSAQSGMGGTPTTGAGGQTSVQANPSLGNGAHGPDTSRPINITGKVVIEDGSAPVQNITIERVCSGMSKTVAYTDPKGRFSFQWGDRNTVVADAMDAGSGTRNVGFGSAQSAGGGNPLAADPFGSRMLNCALRANLAGYSSDAVNLFNKQIADNPDVGVIVLRRIAGVEGAAVSLTSELAPKDAKRAYEHGLQSLLKNKPDDAAKDFEKAVAVYPKYADAWVNLGKVRLGQQAVAPARAALQKAIESDPKLVVPYVELGILAAKDANWQDSGKYLDHAVQLDPVDFPQAWYADAVANYNLKQYDAAEKSARAAIKLDPHHVNPRADYLLGLVLGEKHDYTGAVAQLNEFVKLAPNAPDLTQVKDQLAQYEKLAGSK
jgi:tetratricopeptide (TPR) repeat protein